MKHRLDQYIINLLKEKGEMRSKDIYASMPEQERNLKSRLGLLKKDGIVVVRDRFYYSLPTDTSSVATKTRPDEKLDQISKQLKRTEADNEVTINKALLLFDKVLDDAAETIEGELYTKATMADKVDLIKSLRWLGATLDQLMKRWNLEHHGYDTNTRQAQEDAKAKTTEREKEALENAPLEDRIVVVAHYQEGMQEILRNLPKKELEDRKV
ncbi:MAG: hypothetical protein OXH00_25950 [Candidatus Poribacteria bacterium]|nr:hypothetical protein [Candidatus Poribacteria bacterium]